MRLFLDGQRLAGERGFVSRQAVTFQQACVGRDPSSCLEQDEIAGDNLLNRDFRVLSLATDKCGRLGEVTQSGDGFFGPILVEHLRPDQ